jgi:MoxR-like ATPase
MSVQPELEQQISRVRQIHQDYHREIGKVIYGCEEAVHLSFISLLCGGHALLLGLPGLGKTRLATTVAKALSLGFCRVQFTPDLMPSDITGTDMIEEDLETGRRSRVFLRGPVFANILLADEINRTPPKTQAALLQAMQEHEVSVGRETYPIEEPFMVLATQNPLEMEGTYVLPEAQLDRFMFCVRLQYPDAATEAAIVKGTTAGDGAEIVPVVQSAAEIVELRRLVRAVPVADEVVDLAVHFVRQTRPDTSTLEEVRKYASYGGSTRAGQSLIIGAKARALCEGRVHVTRDDVKAMALPVLRHRLVLNYRAKADGIDSDGIIKKILG